MVSFTIISSTNHTWKKVNSEDNIIVYNCEVEGSKFKKSKVETTINFSNLKNAEIVLKDVSKYKNWQPNCSSSKLIKAEGNKIYSYLTFDAPWPVSDRDLILESTFTKSENRLMMKTTCKPNYIKKDDDFVRITYSEGLWEIEQKNDGNLIIRNTNHSSPGGNIPAWLSSSAVENMPIETIQGFKKALRELE